MLRKFIPILVSIIWLFISAHGQRDLGAHPTDSGGVLMPEQAACDVKH